MLSTRISNRTIFLFLLLSSLLIYANSMSGDFLLDDKPLIINNEYIKHLNTLPLLFTTHVGMFSMHSFELGYSYYRPLQTLSFAIDYYLWRLNPFGYHLSNIIIHSFNALLVFYLLYQLFSNYPLALLSAILFCLHPIHTESVSYISGRSELLVGLFTLLTLVFYRGYLDSRKGWSYLVSILSFTSALISREAGFLIFVPLFILITGLRSNLPKKSIYLNFLSFAGIVGIYIILRLTFLVPIGRSPTSPFPFLSDILNFLNVTVEYTKLFLFPHSLHILRSIAPISSYRPINLIAPLLFLLSLLIILIVSLKQRKYTLIFGITWFILALSYLIKFMYKFNVRIAMEEHWVYLASIGFFVVLSSLILSIKRQKLIKLISAFIIIGYATLTFINAKHWKREIDFYRYNLRFVQPQISIIPRLSFITALSKRGLYKEAMEQVNFILLLAPQMWMAHIQAGDIFRQMKRFAEAKEAYKNALKIDYFCWQANQRLRSLAQETGEQYKDELDPLLSPAETKVISLIRMGNFSEAIEALREILSVSPSPQFYTLAGITLGKIGQYHKAIEAFEAALKINPRYPLALYNLAILYENMGNPKKAMQLRENIEQVK